MSSASDSSTTTADENDLQLADDAGAPRDRLPPPATITEAIRRASEAGQYVPADRFFAPPTPEQLRRQRRKKLRKVPFTYVRKHAPTKRRELFVDEGIKRRIKKINIADVDKSKWRGIDVVSVPEIQVPKEEYVVNSNEFKVVEVVGRVYKPSVRRKRIYDDGGMGIGIGGYIVRYADGHEFCVPLPSSPIDVSLSNWLKLPIDQLNDFIARYPGLEELIEEFEHLSLANEDEDRAAIAYFKAQQRSRLQDEGEGI